MLYHFFHFAYGIAVLLNLLEELDLQGRAVKCEQGSTVSHVDFFLLECHLYLCRQLEQSEIVGDGCSAFSYSFRNFFLGHAFILQEMLICQCNLYGVEVLALDVLYERHFHHVFIADGADVSRDGCKSCQLGCSPAALTCNNLEVVFCNLAQCDRLNDAYCLDALCQFAQSLFVKFASWLVGVCLDLVDGYFIDCAAALSANAFCGYEGIESAA